jgi:iron complex outermembrane receptor protein
MHPIHWRKFIAESSFPYALVVRVVGECRRAIRWIAVSVLLSLLSFAGNAEEAAPKEFDFDIPRQRADVSLTQFAEQADQTLIFPYDDVRTETANRLVGRYPVDVAVTRLLAGTGLQPVFNEQGALTAITKSDALIGEQGMNVKNKTGFGAALAAIFGAPLANAQAPQELVIDEIVVTAQIREENFQDIPVTGTIFGAAMLENNRLFEIDDIARFTPGFASSYFNNSSPSYSVRGAMNTFTQAGASKPVGIFIDDVFVPRYSAAAFELFDIRQVSVLRGPQGTLFGRNVTAGAIQVYTSEPSLDDTRLKVQAGVGDYNLREISAFASGPLSDTVAGKLSVSQKTRDGYSVDRFNGLDVEDLDSFNLRAALLFTPNEDLEIRLLADYAKDENGGKGYTFVSSNNGLDTIGNDGDIRTTELRVPQTYDRDISGVSAHIDWSLESGTVQSITAYRQSDSHDYYSLGAADVTLPSVSTQFLKDDVDEPSSFSQEIRFVSREYDGFDFVAGVYYYDEDTDRYLGDLLLGANGNAQFANRDFFVTAKTESVAAYLSATFHVNEKFDIGIGGRYTSEDKDVTVDFVDNLNAANSFITNPSSSFSEFTPRITLSYFPNEDVTLFASRTEGFTAGGFNTETNAIAAIELGFKPETITAYEVGAKTSWQDGRLIANVTLFDQEYKDKQEGYLLPGSFFSIFNAAKASMTGAELELSWLATEALSVSATYSKLDAEYDEFVIPGGDDFSGNKLQTAPEGSFSLAIDYENAVANGSVLAGISYTWQDEYFTGASNVPEFLIDSYGLFNARIGYAWSDEKWRVMLWGRNLSDEDFVRIRGTSGAIAEYYGPPRTYGLSLTYSH